MPAKKSAHKAASKNPMSGTLMGKKGKGYQDVSRGINNKERVCTVDGIKGHLAVQKGQVSSAMVLQEKK